MSVYLILQGVCVFSVCVQGKGVCVYVIYIGGMCMSVQGRYVCLTWGGGGGDVYKEGVYVKHWDGGRGLLTRHVCVSGTLEEMFMSVYKEDV